MFYSNWRFRLVLFSLILLLVSGYFSYVEMVYFFESRPAAASVTGASEVTASRRGTPDRYVRVEYAFAEPNGVRRTGSDRLPLGWRPPADGVIRVQYTPGEYGRSRVVGNANVWVLILFGGSLAALAVFGFLLWLEAREATRPREPVRRRRRDATRGTSRG